MYRMSNMLKIILKNTQSMILRRKSLKIIIFLNYCCYRCQTIQILLCNTLERTGKTLASIIKDVIEPMWPTSKVTTKHDVWNLRVKVTRLMPTFLNPNSEYEEFKLAVNAKKLLWGIDNKESMNDDEACELSQSL